MEHYAGLDVSLELTSVCIADAQGEIVSEAKVASEPEVLTGFLRDRQLAIDLAVRFLLPAVRDAVDSRNSLSH